LPGGTISKVMGGPVTDDEKKILSDLLDAN